MNNNNNFNNNNFESKNFKQIEFNEITGKLFLVDYNNNTFECNLFGEPIPIFHSNFSGTNLRKKKNISTDNNNNNNYNKIENIYRPIENKFDGYFSFPNPISFPFINEHKINNKNNNKLINQIIKENRFKNSNFSKKFLYSKIPLKFSDNNNNKKYISYLNSKIVDNDKKILNYNEKIINHLINLINNHINEKKINNPNYIEDIEKKDKEVKALLKFKNSLINRKKNFFHLNLPDEKDLIEYKIIKKVINKKNFIENNNNNINKEIYKKLNSIPGIKNISLLNNNNIINNNVNPKKKEKNSLLLLKQKNNSMANLKININQYYNDIKRNKNNFNKNISIKQNEFSNKSFLTTNKDNKTITTEIENTNNNIINTFDNNIKNKFNRNFNNNNITEKNNKNFKEKIIKSFSEINIKSSKENKLLEGYKMIQEKEKPIFKHFNFKPKNAGENYLKDQKLLEIINPIYKQLNEEKFLKDKQLFEKRKKNKLIFELILLKKKK